MSASKKSVVKSAKSNPVAKKGGKAPGKSAPAKKAPKALPVDRSASAKKAWETMRAGSSIKALAARWSAGANKAWATRRAAAKAAAKSAKSAA